MMKVYVSGPVTGLDPELVRASFAARCAWVTAQGWEPVNPTEVIIAPGCGCVPEHGYAHGWSCFMRACLRLVLDCEAITMLPGWERSHGARAELFVATVAGLSVVDGE